MSSVAVFVSLDYHSESIQMCVMTEDGRTLRNRRVPNEVGHVVECVRGGGGVALSENPLECQWLCQCQRVFDEISRTEGNQ